MTTRNFYLDGTRINFNRKINLKSNFTKYLIKLFSYNKALAHFMDKIFHVQYKLIFLKIAVI